MVGIYIYYFVRFNLTCCKVIIMYIANMLTTLYLVLCPYECLTAFDGPFFCVTHSCKHIHTYILRFPHSPYLMDKYTNT